MPAHFSPALFAFLADLARHNNLAWFEKNKARYEHDVRGPALSFIADFSGPLTALSPYFVAEPRKVGGSLFRIYRDTRFSPDKRPFKTNVGIQFRHRSGKDAHAPAFYLHLEPGECFIGAGCWRPDGPALARIRAAIDHGPAAWKAAAHSRAFTSRFALWGDTLQRPPRPFTADHPWIDDLKRKHFIGIADVTDEEVVTPGFFGAYVRACQRAAPLVELLCGALELPF